MRLSALQFFSKNGTERADVATIRAVAIFENKADVVAYLRIIGAPN
jgi:hypothetical protein